MNESEEDRKNQELVQNTIQTLCNWELVPTRTLDPYDFIAYIESKRVALIEVRKRHCVYSKYDKLWMSYIKYKQLRLLGDGYEVPVLYVIIFDDGIYYTDLTLRNRLPTSYGSRGKNPDKPRKTDYEKVVAIHRKYFKRIDNMSKSSHIEIHVKYYCIVCGEEITGADIEDRHTYLNEDCHKKCCPICKKDQSELWNLAISTMMI